MLKTIIVLVLICFSDEQNFTFALPLNADNAIETPLVGEYTAETNIIFGRSPQPFSPETPFIVNPGENDVPYLLDLPQFNTQFATNGLQSDFTAGFNIPFASGNLMNPSESYYTRDLGQTAESLNQPLQQPKFKTETFEPTPNGQNHYENDQLVEQIPNPVQTGPLQGGMDQNGSPIISPPTLNNIPPQNPMQQQQPQLQIPIQQQQQPIQQQQFPPITQQQQPQLIMQPQQQQQQPQLIMQPQQQPPQPIAQQQQFQSPMQQDNSPKPIVRMSSVGAASSTYASSINNQPPQVTETAGAYNYNYDSSKPNPATGNYVAAAGHTPNINDPNNGNYAVSYGSYPYHQPQQQQPYSQSQMSYNQPIQPNLRQYQQQSPNSPILQRQFSSNMPNHSPINQPHYQTPHLYNTLNNHIGRLGQLPHHVAAPVNQILQVIPGLLGKLAAEGLQLIKAPIDMSGAALDALIDDIGNVHFNEFVKVPTQGGRAVITSIQDLINQMQTSMQQQQQQQLVRRTPEPYILPDVDFSQYIPYNAVQENFNKMRSNIFQNANQYIPYDVGQQRFEAMKNNVYNAFQSNKFPQLTPFAQNPILPQQSSNGDPIVKVSSSSVSESTHSSSINGGPPEVDHQAAGFTYDYDSTKTDNPIDADLVALKSHTTDASDPTKGTFVAYENSYPQKNGDD